MTTEEIKQFVRRSVILEKDALRLKKLVNEILTLREELEKVQRPEFYKIIS